ncbi:MAG: hypothetical protein R2705_11290 [Ilumatobacteraceae bacterium]
MAGETVAAGGVLPSSNAGAIQIRASSPVHVALDVNGYFTR